MRALLDVNVLIALLDAGHAQHGLARDWLQANQAGGWASCPLTQNGCVRILSLPNYPRPNPVAEVVARLRQATSHLMHAFWPDDVSALDASVLDPTRVHGPKQLADLYLLALAVHHGGRLVTFDRAIALAAVKGAQSRHLVAL